MRWPSSNWLWFSKSKTCHYLQFWIIKKFNLTTTYCFSLEFFVLVSKVTESNFHIFVTAKHIYISNPVAMHYVSKLIPCCNLQHFIRNSLERVVDGLYFLRCWLQVFCVLYTNQPKRNKNTDIAVLDN